MRNSFDPIDIIKIIIFTVLALGIVGVFVYAHVLKGSHEHTSGSWVTETAATCTEDGYRYQTCTDCNRKFGGEVIPALGHDGMEPVRENIVEASSTTGGSYDEISYCSRCDEVVSTKHVIVEVHDHKAATPVIENKVEATCETDGSFDTVVYCSICDAVITRDKTIEPALGHKADPDRESVIENRVEPSCSESGSFDTVTYCSVCGEDYDRKTEVIYPIPHTRGERTIENNVPPTCTEAGSYDEVFSCRVCGGVAERTKITVPKTGHTPADAVAENSVAPTCTEIGTYDSVVYCDACDVELSRTLSFAEPTGHSYVGELAYNETSGKFELTIKCANEDTVVAVIDTFSEGELISEVTTEPDCMNEGVRVYTATVIYDGYTVSAETSVAEPTTVHQLTAYDKDGVAYNVVTTAYYDDGEGNVVYGYLYDAETGIKYYLISTPGIAASIDSSKGETYNTIWDENGFALGHYKCEASGEWRTVNVYDPAYDTRLA